MLKISVVVPAYNEEQYLPVCLQSLKEQDYAGDWEIIVVDNASTDSTAQIARDFGVKVVSCPRKGVVFARQAGVEASQGDIIVQADADARFPAKWLSRLVQRLTEQRGVVAVAGDIRYIKPPIWADLYSRLWRLLKKAVYMFWKRPSIIYASNIAYWKVAFVCIGGYNFALPGIGDEADFISRLRKVGKVDYASDIVIFVSSRRLQGRLCQYVFADVFYYTVLCNLLYNLTGKSIANERVDIRLGIESGLRLQPRWVFAVLIPVVLAMVAILVYGYFSPGTQVFGKVYSKETPSGKANLLEDGYAKVIALSFDDGPNEPYTSQVLDILKRYDVKATFFVLGKNVAYYPDVSRRIVDEDHILGNHTYDHKVTTPLLNWDRQLDLTQEIITRITGVKPRLFRAPFGQKTPWELDGIHKKGFVTIAWSISANDPHASSSDTIAQRIIVKARPGGIILLHDGYETKHGANRSRTVESLPYIIENLQAQGYTFVTIPQLLDIPGYFE
ncbi:MAG: glycosyltransferase [Dehalococcoidia bacterium]|nr:glycosyltransferase [Dehalococcoidia bacterium]